MNSKQNYPENNVTNPSPIFTKSLNEDYNREMDWLWVATKVTKIDEQVYCLRRALYISPNSHRVRYAMQDLLRESQRRARLARTDKPLFRRLMDYFTTKSFSQNAPTYGKVDLVN
ncbi:MAG: hypothetical protein RLP44_19955 [Aggregatilineales bacterium]